MRAREKIETFRNGIVEFRAKANNTFDNYIERYNVSYSTIENHMLIVGYALGDVEKFAQTLHNDHVDD